MEITTINTELVAKMFLAGAKNLDAKKEWINELNVFPVPDGDTGTNMSMTIMSVAEQGQQSSSRIVHMESVFVILMQAFTDRFFLFTGAVQFTDPVLSRRKRPRDLSAPLALKSCNQRDIRISSSKTVSFRQLFIK